MAIRETKFIGTPSSGSAILDASGIIAPVSHDQKGTHQRSLLHQYPARFPVFGSKYAPDPVPISLYEKIIHPAFLLHAAQLT